MDRISGCSDGGEALSSLRSGGQHDCHGLQFLLSGANTQRAAFGARAKEAVTRTRLVLYVGRRIAHRSVRRLANRLSPRVEPPYRMKKTGATIVTPVQRWLGGITKD